MTIRSFELLDVILTPRIPVLDRQAVSRADHARLQIVATLAEPDLRGIDAGQELRHIGVAGRGIVFLHRVGAVAATQDIGVISRPASQRIGARSTIESVGQG